MAAGETPALLSSSYQLHCAFIDQRTIQAVDHGVCVFAAARYADGAAAVDLAEECADGDRRVLLRGVDGAGGVAIERGAELLENAALAARGEGGWWVIDRRGNLA